MSRAARAMVVALLAAATSGRAADDAGVRVRTWLESGPSQSCFDVVFVGDGYVKGDLVDDGKYWRDVGRYAKRFLEDPPFSWYRTRTNVRAVFLESTESGCAASPEKTTPNTALKSHFDSPKGRLLEFGDGQALRAAVERAGKADLVFVMVNTERYGGAGTTLDAVVVRGRPLPAPTFAAQDTTSFLIALHELGHSLAGLADEYADAKLIDEHPLPGIDGDLAEPNVTMPWRVDPSAKSGLRSETKWAHFAKIAGGAERKWAHEGGYYRDKGVFRPWAKCRMRDHADPFCPVCCEQVAKAIQAATGDSWDDAAWHAAHPLSLWK